MTFLDSMLHQVILILFVLKGLVNNAINQLRARNSYGYMYNHVLALIVLVNKSVNSYHSSHCYKAISIEVSMITDIILTAAGIMRMACDDYSYVTGFD